MRRTAPVIGIAVSAVAIALSGCGSSNDKSDGGLSKKDFVAQANAVCKRHNEKISAAASKVLAGGKLPSPQKFGMLVMGTIVPEQKAQVGELRAIKPPSELAGAYDKWLADAQATGGRIAKNPPLIQNPASFAKVNGEADRLGLSPKCHIGPG